MAADPTQHQLLFAFVLHIQLDIINLAIEKSMNICTFNQQQLSADGTRNTATTPSRHSLAVRLKNDNVKIDRQIKWNKF